MIWLMDRLVRLLTHEIALKDVRRPLRFIAYPVTLPSHVSLRTSRWLVFPNANATTYGNTIVFRPDCATLGTLMHELVHVAQWNEYGFFGFSWRYIKNAGALEAPAYRAGNPFHVGGL